MHLAGERLENQQVPIWELQVSIQQPDAAPRGVAACLSTGSRAATQVPIQQPIGGDVSWVNPTPQVALNSSSKNGPSGNRKRHPGPRKLASPGSIGTATGSAAKTVSTWARIGSYVPRPGSTPRNRTRRLKEQALGQLRQVLEWLPRSRLSSQGTARIRVPRLNETRTHWLRSPRRINPT